MGGVAECQPALYPRLRIAEYLSIVECGKAESVRFGLGYRWEAEMLSRRQFITVTGATTVGLFVATQFGWVRMAEAQIPGGTLDPGGVGKYETPLLIPPAMPKAGTIKNKMGKNGDYYEISMMQFDQQILPVSFPATTVWGYGAVVSASKKIHRCHHRIGGSRRHHGRRRRDLCGE